MLLTTYPGVYLQELPSGDHTVTPVATNVAAFVGRAPVGPTDVPVTIFNFGDYTRAFGGLAFDYPMSYAVQDFFLNGGSQAIICRLFEPAGSDGFAQIRFAGGPPALPVGWDIDADAPIGASSVPVWGPDGEGEPDLGQLFTVNGDRSQKYLVTGYTPAAGKAPATMSFLPALAKPSRKCAPLVFSAGDDPQGWSVQSLSNNTVTLTGGLGLPSLGDGVTFGADPTSYTVIADPTVTGTDPASMQVQVQLAPKPPGPLYTGSAATFGQPQPMPMPAGWEIDQLSAGKTPSSATMTLINGTGAPLVGDQFSFGDDPGLYAVTGFTPATAKASAQMTFQSLGGDPVDLDQSCHCCAPVFIRPPPSNWAMKAAPKPGATQLAITPGPGVLGVVDVGDSFQVDNDPIVYVVRGVDPASSTVYFLPEASAVLAAAKELTFKPALTLRAANPGTWGNRVTASADMQGITAASVKVFREYGLTIDDVFNLTLVLRDKRGQILASERFLNVTVRTDGDAGLFPNRLDRVLAGQSNLARVVALSGLPPADGALAAGTGGDDGTYLEPGTYLGDPDQKTGLYMLQQVEAFNLMCIPPDRRMLPGVPLAFQDLPATVRQEAAQYCTDRRAFFIVDPPAAWSSKYVQGQLSTIDPDEVGITGMNAAGIEVARNAAVYFPRVYRPDPLMKSQPALFPPCGIVAGIMAATDVGRGVWKAPAGMDAGLAGVSALEFVLNDDENGQLNPLGVNCLRSFPVIGPVVWGARTLRGADAFDDDYKYVPVRRLTLFIESSLLAATRWAVFEPNNETLWSALRLEVGSFMADLSRQGAFYDYSVACDATTTTADDIALGKVNMLVRIAPVKPAEFVVIQIQQTTSAKSS